MASCKSGIEVKVARDAEIATSTTQDTSTIQSTSGAITSDTQGTKDAPKALRPGLTGLSPLAAKSGEVVKLFIENLKDLKDPKIIINGTQIPLSIAPDGSAEFIVPEGISPGTAEVKLESKTLGDLGQATMLVSAGDYPISTMGPAEVCMGKRYRNARGEIQTGTLDCGTRPLCSASLQVDCLATVDFKSVPSTELISTLIKNGATIGGVTGIYPSATAPLAANTTAADLTSFGPTTPVGVYEFFDSAGNVYSANILDGGTITPGMISQSLSSSGSLYRGVTVSGNAALLASNIKSGVSLFGVSGSLTPAPANCTTNNASGCVTTDTYKSADWTNLTAANIKNGISVAGLTGTYPSSGNLLAGASATADLDSTTFNAKIKSAAAFEYFGPDGTRYTGAGDGDITAANILSSVDIFGTTGSVTASPANCSAAAQTGCVTTATYKSMDLSQMGASSATGLTAANFDTKLTSGANFEFWDASGGRHLKAGDVDLTTANVKDTVVIFGVTGTLTGAPVNCSTNGEQNCLATATFFGATECSANDSNCYVPTYVATTKPLKAISYDAIDAGKSAIRTSLTLSGIVGTLADCTTNNTSGCVTTATYKSADWTNLAAANIKSGASVAGLTGTYPSSGNLLAGADSTADLDTATFDAKIKSATSFEFFGPDGTRYTGAGDADITAGNIASGVTIFGTTGTASAGTQCTSGVQATCESDTACRWNTGACEINPWHIRAGITVASKAGSLKTNCRNTINSTYYNWDGSVASLPNTVQTGGTAYDFWDTIDDYYGYAPNKVAAWSTNTQCDSSNWTDVTTTNGGSSFTTCGTSSTCIYRDELSGLRVTGILSSGNNTTDTANPATYNWRNAIKACDGSTYGGYAAGTWRLPTQKELMSLYEHGLVSRAAAGFHTLSNLQASEYWSSSSRSDSTGSGWYVDLIFGHTNETAKTGTTFALCVY